MKVMQPFSSEAEMGRSGSLRPSVLSVQEMGH